MFVSNRSQLVLETPTHRMLYPGLTLQLILNSEHRKSCVSKQEDLKIIFEKHVGLALGFTPPKTNMEADHWWFVDVFPFPVWAFFGFHVSF